MPTPLPHTPGHHDNTPSGVGEGREVVWADALPWMRERGQIAGACAVTSLPDVSEVGTSLAVWRAWFWEAVGLVVAAVPEASVTVRV